MRERILIVDDEPSIRIFLSDELAREGYDVLTAASGEEALAQLQKKNVDLLLLDLMMDGLDGLEVMSQVKQQAAPPVVIMITAHASVDSAVRFMKQGGHDYIVKPYCTEDLLAKIEEGLIHRREMMHKQSLIDTIQKNVQQLQADFSPLQPTEIPSSATRYLEGRGLLLDRQQHTVTRYGEPVKLTPTEFDILVILMESGAQTVSVPTIMQQLHDTNDVDPIDARQALSTHLWRLRSKIGEDKEGNPYIVNVRGRGYKFVE